MNEHTTDELLNHLTQFGKPWLTRMDKGWHAWVNMNTTSRGSSFEVKSEMNHPTANAALMVCCERVQDAMKVWQETSEKLTLP